MHSRRLDDRIRELCAQIAAASKTDLSSGELDGILRDLLCAVHEKIERLRILAAKHLIGREPSSERRATPAQDEKFPLKS
jgi:hypothetical protein